MRAKRLQAFGASIFGVMTRLAQTHDAINLSQGFPDFEGPGEILDAAIAAMRAGHNQYARPFGALPLVQAVAAQLQRDYGLELDAEREICVTCGATEAIAASLLGVLNPGDGVLAFEPFYDSYPALAALAGAEFTTLPLRFPDFRVDPDALRDALRPNTRVLILNSPHNPSGRVFDDAELAAIAELCVERDLIAVCDEVYEHLVYDGHSHRPLMSFPGMRERTIGISSTGKTFSLTGWKIGWAYAAPALLDAVYAAHQFLTFSVASPLQHGMAHALRSFQGPWLDGFRSEYDARRLCLLQLLEAAGFECARPQGSYFILATHPALFAGGHSDREVAEALVRENGVAAIPPSSFYMRARDEGRRLLRFAFCKEIETLEAAGSRLASLASGT